MVIALSAVSRVRRRAEHAARELLRSCVSDAEWQMYRELGFIRVWGAGSAGLPCAYLVYAHRPIVAYQPQTGRALAEYAVEFTPGAVPSAGARLADSDDVLAKWMALTGDEQGLLARASRYPPGSEIDRARLARDLWRLSRWEREATHSVGVTPLGDG